MSGGRVCAELMYCDFMGELVMKFLIKWQNGSPCQQVY